ncbi:hypothetical protein GRI43_08370 [Altererythrobacter luteolus]|uniref:Uncharacterized protein n=1 Tax=Pontixanthobacter luteolus TaxID=295089 RepID=A0A6I4V126_9SPHN|nr:hypothetical protein [Pontixanthobacter luteolus]MXP47405.1 hypothetical protein [Pontixanthobacter luteolus]
MSKAGQRAYLANRYVRMAGFSASSEGIGDARPKAVILKFGLLPAWL